MPTKRDISLLIYATTAGDRAILGMHTARFTGREERNFDGLYMQGEQKVGCALDVGFC